MVLRTETVDGFAVGRVEGVGSVSADGAARYVVPLRVPRGRAGLQPDLTLSYDSDASDGPLGVGWSLTGLPRISRVPRTLAQDGAAAGIEFTEADPFSLDGQRLVVVGGPEGLDSRYGGHETEYRTERDMHAKVVSYDPDALGPRYFKVFLKDGRILTLGGGGTANSWLEGQRIRVTPGTRPNPDGRGVLDDVFVTDFSERVRLAWALARVEDRAGNCLDVRHALRILPEHGHEHVPASMAYTSSVHDAAVGPTRFVDFVYEARPDTSIHYVAGFRLARVSRLTRIEMHVTNDDARELVRAYELSYRNDSVTRRSLLAALTESDGAGVRFAPTQFTWSLGEDGFEDIATGITDVWQPEPSQLLASNLVLLTGDFDGDGRDDVLYRSRDGQSWTYRLSIGGGFGPPHPVDFRQRPDPSPSARPMPAGRLVDLDDDRRDEFLLLERAVGDPPRFRNRAWRWSAQGVVPIEDDVETYRQHAQQSYAVDLDGDGRQELVGDGRTSDWAFRRRYGDWYGPLIRTPFSRSVPGPFSPPFRGYAVDVDGSGRVCLLLAGSYGGSGSRSAALYADGDVARVRPTNIIYDRDAVFLDVNGDGLVDWVFKGPRGTLSVSLNTGNGFAEPRPWSAPSPIGDSESFIESAWADSGLRVLDYDGDGNQDLLLAAGFSDSGERRLVILRADANGFTPLPLPIRAGSRSGRELVPVSTPTAEPSSWRLSQVLDATGDGLADFVQVVDGEMHLYRRKGARPDVLEGVRDGLNASERFTYRPMTDRSVYQAGEPSMYPQERVIRGRWVVAAHEVDSGLSTPRRMSYFYRDGRRDLTGRGWLGFGVVEVVDEATGSVTQTRYDHRTRHGTAYPFLGLPTTTRTDIPLSNNRVRRRITASSYDVITGARGRVWFAHTSTVRHREYEGTSPNPSLLHLEHVRRTADEHGNLTHEVREVYTVRDGVPVGRPAVLESRNTFANFEGSWLVGLLMRASTRSTTERGETATRKVEHDYDAVTGLLIRTRLQPRRRGARDVRALLDRRFERDELGLVRAVVEASACETRTELFSYAAPDFTDLATVTNAVGHTTTFVMDRSLGEPVVIRDPNGLKTTYSYDGFVRLRAVRRPDGANIDVSYGADSSGRPVVRTRPSGAAEVEVTFDRKGREVRRRRQTFDGRARLC